MIGNYVDGIIYYSFLLYLLNVDLNRLERVRRYNILKHLRPTKFKLIVLVVVFEDIHKGSKCFNGKKCCCDAVYVGGGNVACRKYPFILLKDKYGVRGCTTNVV